MPIVRLRDLVVPAARAKYAVPAFNVVDDVSMLAVLDTAANAGAPVVIQASVRTVRLFGVRPMKDLFAAAVADRDVTAALHLDHCGDPDLVRECLKAGWSSALFDSSELPYAEAVQETTHLARFADELGADLEAEFERIPRGDESVDFRSTRDLDRTVEFIRRTNVRCFGPDIGTLHGPYPGTPELDLERASAIAEATGVPLVLHGATGLSTDQLIALISRGFSKVNISTLLKQTYLGAVRSWLRTHDSDDPTQLFKTVRTAVEERVSVYFRILGAVGRS